jgi:hypothetical protein
VIFSSPYVAKKVFFSELLNIINLLMSFSPKLLDFEKCKVQISKKKKHKNQVLIVTALCEVINWSFIYVSKLCP